MLQVYKIPYQCVSHAFVYKQYISSLCQESLGNAELEMQYLYLVIKCAFNEHTVEYS